MLRQQFRMKRLGCYPSRPRASRLPLRPLVLLSG
jgi:hypothetical protein